MNFIHRALRRLLLALFSLVITIVILLCFCYAYIELQLPNVQTLNDVHFQEPLRVYTSDGKLIGEYGAKRRIPITLSQVPKPMIQAVLATEDARFYSHPGVDFVGLVRAAVAVIQSGRKVQGASTITMQVARNFFLSPKKTYTRKIREILLALKIDREFPKDKILELYLNRVYFGNRAYGVAAAAQIYYGKALNQLTLPEMAMIAGLPQAPSRDNPLINPGSAIKRRNHVLERMYEVGFITREMFLHAIKAPNTAAYHGQSVGLDASYVGEMVRQAMFTEYNDAAYVMGLKVYTTISSKLQKAANQSLADGLIAYSERHGYDKPSINFGKPSALTRDLWVQKLSYISPIANLIPAAVLNIEAQAIEVLTANNKVIRIDWNGLSWAKPLINGDMYPVRQASSLVTPGDQVWIRKDATTGNWMLVQYPKVQGALVAMSPQNGAVEALTGGFDFQHSNFNRVVQAERQPGSNFKPFIYSAALERGFTLASILNDAPLVVYDNNQIWRPVNDDFKFYGPTRLRIALTQSRNLASVRLLQSITVPYAIHYLRRFGFNIDHFPHSLSLALGTPLVTPMQMAEGYSVFANGGYQVTPYLIAEVDQGNKILFKANPAKACEVCIFYPDVPKDRLPNPMAPQTLSPQNAFLITNVLQDVIKSSMGTGHAAAVLNRPDLAGKTGTNGLTDGWFSGFNSDLEATVWIGYDNYQPIHEFGAKAALPIWIEFMRDALLGQPEHSMPEPPGIVNARIDPNTGLLAQTGQNNAIFEVFNKLNAPHDFSSVAAQEPTNFSGTANHNSGSSGGGSTSNEPLF